VTPIILGLYLTNLASIITMRRMNSPTTGLRIASVLFGIFAIAHVLRLINHAQVTVGTHTIPMAVSWIALVVAGILCVWFWRLSNLRGIA
jgi:uncharacterized membrane protein YecN with MAPEG domain